MQMEYETRQEGQVTIIALHGELDVSSAPLLRDLLQQLLDQGKNQFLLDLSGVDFIDSSGLGIFVNAYKRTRSAGGTMKLFNPQEAVRKVFSLTQTDKVFSIYDSMEDALRSFSGGCESPASGN
jgi:anti-sigma B factor antagonist